MMMASPGTKEYLPDFIKTQKTSDYPYITVGYDNADFIKKVYLYQALPQIDIYNSDHKLIRIFTRRGAYRFPETIYTVITSCHAFSL